MDYSTATLHPYDHYRFLKPRKDKTASNLVLIVDTYFTGNPKQDRIVIMDVREYQPTEPRTFKTVPAIDFLTLIEENKIEKFVPKV